MRGGRTINLGPCPDGEDFAAWFTHRIREEAKARAADVVTVSIADFERVSPDAEMIELADIRTVDEKEPLRAWRDPRLAGGQVTLGSDRHAPEFEVVSRHAPDLVGRVELTGMGWSRRAVVEAAQPDLKHTARLHNQAAAEYEQRAAEGEPEKRGDVMQLAHREWMAARAATWQADTGIPFCECHVLPMLFCPDGERAKPVTLLR